MSLQGIINRFFSSTGSIERRSTGTTSTGDLTETWSALASNVPFTIQPLSISELNALNQGTEFNASHKGYMPDSIVTPKNGDRLVDSETGKTHDIVGVQHHQAARIDIALGHHYKLYLQIPKDDKA
jgi:hypothetical protein